MNSVTTITIWDWGVWNSTGRIRSETFQFFFHSTAFKIRFASLTGILCLSFFIQNCILTLLKFQRNPENNTRDLCIAFGLVAATYLFIGASRIWTLSFERDWIKLFRNRSDEIAGDSFLKSPSGTFSRFRIQINATDERQEHKNYVLQASHSTSRFRWRKAALLRTSWETSQPTTTWPRSLEHSYCYSISLCTLW